MNDLLTLIDGPLLNASRNHFRRSRLKGTWYPTEAPPWLDVEPRRLHVREAEWRKLQRLNARADPDGLASYWRQLAPKYAGAPHNGR